MFCKTKFSEILRETAGDCERFFDARGGPYSLGYYIDKAETETPAGDCVSAYRNALEGMADFLEQKQASLFTRQRLWDELNEWALRLAKALGLGGSACFEEYSERPIETDAAIGLVKALHDKSGITKKQLAERLGVKSERTVRNYLRALDPNLSEGEGRPAPLRVGGHIIRVKIDVTEETTGARKYHTENRLHPIVLQLNTMQTGHLLLALENAYHEKDDSVCFDTAHDIWFQLSETAQERIREVYACRNKDLADFIDELEDDDSLEREVRFRPEYTQREDMSLRQQLESAFKSSCRVTLTLRRGTERKTYKNMRIDRCDSDFERWLAVPADEWSERSNKVEFTEDDVAGEINFLY